MNVAISTAALVADDPVFHRWNDHPRRSRSTACGCRPWGNTNYVVVRRDHAEKIARPCGKCWPKPPEVASASAPSTDTVAP